MAKNLYLFVGLPCSGKTHAANLIQAKVLGPGKVISAGDIARSLMTTQDLKDQTAAKDLFPLEDQMRQALQKSIEEQFEQHDRVIVEGMPRFAEQASWAIDTFWLYSPTIVEVSVGDTVTLFNRAKMRGRDTDLNNFAQRLDTASKNLSGVYDILHQRFIPHYTLFSGDDAQMVLNFRSYFKIKAST
jgi:adenylate kinase family enzyme